MFTCYIPETIGIMVSAIYCWCIYPTSLLIAIHFFLYTCTPSGVASGYGCSADCTTTEGIGLNKLTQFPKTNLPFWGGYLWMVIILNFSQFVTHNLWQYWQSCFLAQNQRIAINVILFERLTHEWTFRSCDTWHWPFQKRNFKTIQNLLTSRLMKVRPLFPSSLIFQVNQ